MGGKIKELYNIATYGENLAKAQQENKIIVRKTMTYIINKWRIRIYAEQIIENIYERRVF
jgi:hypothetical protein